MNIYEVTNVMALEKIREQQQRTFDRTFLKSIAIRSADFTDVLKGVKAEAVKREQRKAMEG